MAAPSQPPPYPPTAQPPTNRPTDRPTSTSTSIFLAIHRSSTKYRLRATTRYGGMEAKRVRLVAVVCVAWWLVVDLWLFGGGWRGAWLAG
jgi:hypothetical protein